MDLLARYGLKPASLEARLQFLGFTPPLEPAQLDQLDALDQHLKGGNSLASFEYTPSAEVVVMEAAHTTESQLAIPDQTFEFDFEQMDRVYSFLQKAADSGWHLPTSVIRSLTGATPRGNYWKRFGFEFVPATRHGSEKAWAVSQATWDFPLGPSIVGIQNRVQ